MLANSKGDCALQGLQGTYHWNSNNFIFRKNDRKYLRKLLASFGIQNCCTENHMKLITHLDDCIEIFKTILDNFQIMNVLQEFLNRFQAPQHIFARSSFIVDYARSAQKAIKRPISTISFTVAQMFYFVQKGKSFLS